MNKMNTATVGLAVTPTVLSTFVSHVCLLRRACDKDRKKTLHQHQTSLLTNVADPGSSSTASLYTNVPRLISPTTRACTSFARSCSMSPITRSRSCRPSRPNGFRTRNGLRSTT